MIKPYKFQASVTLLPQPGAAQPAELPGPACRVVVRAAQPSTAGNRLFSALVTPGQDTVPGDKWHTVLTVTVLGDGADECLAAGSDFTLWRGSDVGRGVVTRRVFV
ncbi:MAG: hypothetical protein ACLPKI_07565 [Streptosporangiaceae bacterium]